MVTHVNSRPDEQYQFSKVVNLGPPIHQSKLSNENCNISQRLTISSFAVMATKVDADIVALRMTNFLKI